MFYEVLKHLFDHLRGRPKTDLLVVHPTVQGILIILNVSAERDRRRHRIGDQAMLFGFV